MGLTAGLTGHQGMLTPLHLILPSLLSGVRVALHSTLYLPIGLYNYVLHIVTFAIMYFNAIAAKMVLKNPENCKMIPENTITYNGPSSDGFIKMNTTH
jgi:hypothetical protein